MDTVFQKHDRLMIYQDPITEQKEEGKAELISFDSSYYELERWTVRFIGEHQYVQRSIHTKGKNVKGKK